MLSLMMVFGRSKNFTSDGQIPTSPTVLIDRSHCKNPPETLAEANKQQLDGIPPGGPDGGSRPCWAQGCRTTSHADLFKALC